MELESQYVSEASQVVRWGNESKYALECLEFSFSLAGGMNGKCIWLSMVVEFAFDLRQ